MIEEDARVGRGSRPVSLLAQRPSGSPQAGSSGSVIDSATHPLVDTRLNLYAWQREAFEAWVAAGHQGVVEAVTGAGKTRLGLAAISEAVRTGRTVLLLVPTIELLNQWRREIRQVLPWVSVGRFGDGHRETLLTHDVIVATVQGVLARIGEQPIDIVGALSSAVLIADECHRYASEEFARSLNESATWRLGLSATYEREDDTHLATLEPYFGGVIYRLWYDRAQQDHLIAPFDIALAGVDLEPAEVNVYNELSDQIRGLHRSLQGYLKPEDRQTRRFLKIVARWAALQEDSAKTFQARKYMRSVTARQRLLAQTPAKLNVLPLLEPALAASQNTILFSLTQDSAKNAASRVEVIGLRAASVYSELPKRERNERMDSFRDGTVPIISAPRILDEGVDVPEADLAIILAANRSRRQMVQRLGRVIRRKPDGRAGKLLVLYARNTVEDPAVSGDAHLNLVLPFARELGYFIVPSELTELLKFLRNPPADAQPRKPTSRGVESPLPARPGGVPTSGRADHPVSEMEAWDGEPREVLKGKAWASEDAVKDYLRKIGRYRLLNAEEEVELARRIEAGLLAQDRLNAVPDLRRRDRRDLQLLVKDGLRAKEKLISANLRLVVNIAKRYMHASGSMGFLDLIQEGNIGLNRAADGFDYAQGTKFSTYATWWIRQAVTRGLADTSRTIRLPVHVVEKLTLLRKLHQSSSPEDLDERGRREATAKAADMSVAEVERMLVLDEPPRSLDVEIWIRDDGGVKLGTLGDLIVDEHGLDSLTQVALQLLPHEIDRLLHELPARDEKILRLRYGLNGEEPMTLDAIGENLGLTRERIRQVLVKNIAHLQDSPTSEALRPSLRLWA